MMFLIYSIIIDLSSLLLYNTTSISWLGDIMIISASRRTDIPSFYADWFMNQIRQGEFVRQNPVTGEIHRSSAKPEDVDAIVFWTRNASPMIKKGYIQELQELGYRFYFQYTITGYTAKSPSNVRLDGASPHPLKAIDHFNALADLIGPEKVIFRFDPIVVCDQISKDEIVRLYSKISSEIDAGCIRNVISFLDVYDSVGSNMARAGFDPIDLLAERNRDQLEYILDGIMSAAAKSHREVLSCAESIDLSRYKIKPSKCIDADYIRSIFGLKTSGAKDPGQRTACGCAKSVDIGQYNTCVHGCVYCYATQERDLATQNFKKHQPDNGLIIPDARFKIATRII